MDGSVESLSVHLDALKRRGANLLVLGPPAARPGCRHLLGTVDETRRRLFVTADGRAENLSQFSPDPEYFRHISIPSGLTRSAADQSMPSELSAALPDEARTSIASVEDLGDIAIAIDDHLAALEATEPVSGEIRVCFDSLDPFVETLAEQQVFRFLHAVTNRIRAANGLGHFHLSAEVDRDVVETLEPLFEATVEYRRNTGGFAQRWRFRDASLETDWLPVD